MLQKLRGNNSKGFTLIELMIVIAIIGILAAIAIPNYISYRNKAYCSAAESDANNIAAALADYFAIPAHSVLPGTNPETAKTAGLGLDLSGSNTGTIGADINNITISVTDVSGNCPDDYQSSQSPQWNGSNVFSSGM